MRPRTYSGDNRYETICLFPVTGLEAGQSRRVSWSSSLIAQPQGHFSHSSKFEKYWKSRKKMGNHLRCFNNRPGFCLAVGIAMFKNEPSRIVPLITAAHPGGKIIEARCYDGAGDFIRRDQCLALESTKQLCTVVESWDGKLPITPWQFLRGQQTWCTTTLD